MIHAVVVPQARMASTRLPGKVMARLGAHTLLAHCVRRLQAAQVGPVVVATTMAAEDDVVEAEAQRLQCQIIMPDVLIDVRRPDLRLTVDTPEDLDFMRRILHQAEAGSSPSPLQAVVAAADSVRREAIP